ncbi:MAG: TrgA family protein [Pseudooceanicola sp.]
MLTMPKLISALMLAFIAWIVSGMVKVEILEVHGTYNFGNFVRLSVIIGALVGWVVLGSRANGNMGFGTAPAVGFTAVFAMVFWILFLVSANEMLRLAIERRFDGPFEALNEMIPIAGDYGSYLIRTHIIATLVGTGMAAGWFADWAARRWK